MGRKILAVITGYISTAIIIFITFTILYFILGADGSFEPNSYRVSTTWIILSIILGLIASLIGGYICMLIGKDKNTILILAGIVLVLGIIIAVPELGSYNEAADLMRSSDTSNMEAMQNAKQPDAILILNPILGAIGVWLGGKLRKEGKAPEIKTA